MNHLCSKVVTRVVMSVYRENLLYSECLLYLPFYCRVSALKEQKERLISLKSRLEDEIKDIETDNTVLSQRVTGIQQTCLTLESQLIGLLCRQEAQSPVLSQAEEWMRDELEGFNSHMHVMIQKIIEVCT